MANNSGTTDPTNKVNASADGEDDEDIIELTDIVEGPGDEDDDIIELTEIVTEEEDESPGAVGAGISRKGLEPDADIENDFIDPGETGPAEAVPVSREQVDAAVEKVVRDIYAEKIETMLFDVVNTVVKDEIGRLKGILEQRIQPDD